jgi:pyruvate dehydrogenase kinase 2/3/4
VIAEQHLALTETFNSPWHFPDAKHPSDMEFVGEVFLKCNAKEVVERCGQEVQNLARGAYGSDTIIPEIRIEGHLEATFPYILSHLEYIIGELLRNSIQAVVERQENLAFQSTPPPIEITICEAPQHVIIRVSDQGGGIPREILPHLWSFSKGPRSQKRLENLHHVPKMAATLQEIKAPTDSGTPHSHSTHNSSLSSLASRPPNLRLGMGLPLSRIYAEYWAGGLELQSLRGYGVDAFLQISKLGNKNEPLTTRASMDAV